MTDTLPRGFATIRKPDRLEPPPNLAAGPEARSRFSWASMEAALDGLPGGGLNLAHEAVDRHAAGPNADRIADMGGIGCRRFHEQVAPLHLNPSVEPG